MTAWMMGFEGWLWMGAWALVLVLVVWLLVREPPHPRRDDAMTALRDRLARGEITPDDFERARRLLESSLPEGASDDHAHHPSRRDA